MTILLLLLMAFQITGQELHEWFGAGILRIIAVVVAGYRAVCFDKADIVSYLLLKNQFAFFDFDKTAVSVFLEYMAIMELWVFAGYYVMKGISRLLSLKKS